MSLAADTFTTTGHAETKRQTEVLPSILNQLGADALTSVRRRKSTACSWRGWQWWSSRSGGELRWGFQERGRLNWSNFWRRWRLWSYRSCCFIPWLPLKSLLFMDLIKSRSLIFLSPEASGHCSSFSDFSYTYFILCRELSWKALRMEFGKVN